MAYKINGSIIIDNSGNLSAGVATATLFDGKVSEKAITEQTAGTEADVSGADEILLYDSQTNGLLRVSVDEFIVGSGIGTLLTEVGDLTITGIATVSGDVKVGRNLSVVGITTLGGQVTIGGTITPDTDVTYDLGSATNRFKDLFLSGSTINLGTATLSSPSTDLLYNGDQVVTKTGENITLTGDLTAANINASGIVTAANKFDGNLEGNVSGTTTGLHNGDVYSRDGSQLVVEVPLSTGDAHYIGTVTGDVTGDLTGDSFGTHTGQTNGDVYTADGGTQVVDTAAAPAPVFKGDAEGLTGTPNITVGTINSGNINSSGVITATSFDGPITVASLNDIGDVDAPSPVNSNALIYNTTTGNWEAGFGPAFVLDSNRNVYADQLTTPTFTTAQDNTLIGLDSGESIIGGNNNTCIGKSSGTRLADGTNNTFIGNLAGEYFFAAADSNVVIGSNSASAVNSGPLTGSKNVIIGNNNGLSSGIATSMVVIGNDVVTNVTGPNLLVGNGANTWIRGNKTYGVKFNEVEVSTEEGGTGIMQARDVAGTIISSICIDSSTGENTTPGQVGVQYVNILFPVSVNNGAQPVRTFNMAQPSYTHRNLKVYLRDTDGTNGVVIDERDFYNDGLGNVIMVPNAPLNTAVTPIQSVGANTTHDISYSISGTTVTVNALKGAGAGGGARSGVMQVVESRFLAPNTI